MGAVAVLLVFGLVMLASASRVPGLALYGNAHYFVIRQAVWMTLGLVAALVASRFDYHRYKSLSLILLAVSIVGLILVFVPGIGVRRGGSSRWINLAGLQFQPSEIVKFCFVAVLSAWYAVRPQRIRTFWLGAVVPFLLIGIMGGLLFIEPDYGTAALIAAVGVGIMFVAGAKMPYLSIFSLLGLCAFSLAILRNPNRLGRMIAFVFPEKYPDLAYQLGQSKDAFTLGGPFGVGLGNSIQKHYYLPEVHTDFIFAIVGEELGLPATGAVILLFLAVFICGLRIGACAPDLYGRLMAFGLALILCLQAGFHIAVVTGCLPTKGITLPFISYGGSSLLISLTIVGVLINIARHALPEYGDRHTRFIRGQELTAADV